MLWIGSAMRGLDRRLAVCYHRSMKEEPQRETAPIWVSRDLHRQLKIKAAERGTDLRTLADAALAKYIEELEGGGHGSKKRTPPG